MNTTTPDTFYHSRWNQPLPEDEIRRQQQMKERLTPGMAVELRGLGRFIYKGAWDTMHTFYPAEGQNLADLLAPNRHHMLRRDLAGRHFIQLPYTILADEVIIEEKF